MTAFETIVVVAGLLAGWFGISAVFTRAAVRKLRSLAGRNFCDEELGETWPKLLQVDRSADLDEIKAACEGRREELRKCFPTMMTETESGEFEQANATLCRAREIAIRQVGRSGLLDQGSG